MAGKPAARLTDITAHGGTLVGPGVPTVLIGKMPAAAMGDQHVCPMVTPATPPIPHVGGPVILGSTGVFVGKKPAARVGDMAVCVGPPSQVVMGCFTVLIGEAGSGSQAGSAGAAAAASTRPPKSPKAVQPIAIKAQESSPTQAYEIQVRVKDKGGYPVCGRRYRLDDPNGQLIKGATSAEGEIVHGGYSSRGSFKVTLGGLGEVKWSSDPVSIDEEQTLSARTDAPLDAEGFFFVNLVGSDGSRLFFDKIPSKVSGGKLEAKWKLGCDRWKRLLEHEAATFQGVEAIALVQDGMGISKVVPLDASMSAVAQVQRLTVKKLADKLVEIESKHGYEIALLGVELLDYVRICDLSLAKRPDDDPNLMPSRFMILRGASDEMLDQNGNLDDFPHSLHGGLTEKVSIRSMARHLEILGRYQSPRTTEPDGREAQEIDGKLFGELYDALCAYVTNADAALDGELDGGTHTVVEGECLSDIAEIHRIREWRLLWQLNKDALGENWDILKAGTELKLPDAGSNPLVEWFSENGWKEYLNPDMGYQYPGKYLSLTFMDQDGKPLSFKDPSGKPASRACDVYTAAPVATLVAKFDLQGGDDFDVLVPDTEEIGIWVEGESIAYGGVRWPSFAEFRVDPERYLARSSGFARVDLPIRRSDEVGSDSDAPGEESP